MKRALVLLLAAVAALLLPAAATAQPNIIPNIPTGWAWPLVPRPAADATAGSVPAPTTLYGGGTTYLNVSCRNIGAYATGSFHSQSRIDGDVMLERPWSSLAAGAVGNSLNGGPIIVRGGRHTLELRLDSSAEVSESSETDNNVARQWVWQPYTLGPDLMVQYDAPPDPTGGWAVIPAGQDKYNNCDGVRITAGSTWDVFFPDVDDLAADYDCLLYSPSTGAQNGFASPLAASRRRGAGIDGVVLNGHNVPGQIFDVGIERIAGASNYWAVHRTSLPLAWGDSASFGFVQGEMLRMFDVSVPAGGVGPITITLQLATTDPSVMALWADRTFQRGALTDLASAATDERGRLQLHVNADAAGQYGLVIMRDPDWGTGPRTFTLKVRRSSVDLAPYAPSGWHSPLVPRPEPDGTPTSVALPDTLPAWNSSRGAVLNYALRNDGGLPCPVASTARITCDDLDFGSPAVPALAAGGVLAVNETWRREVKAGRHTLSLHADFTGAITELDEEHNHYGEQYCWAPIFEVPLGDLGWGFPSPPLYANAESVTSGEPFWPNCNAWRTPPPPSSAWWIGFAITPDAGNDADLTLHETLRGTKNGFAESLTASGWGTGQSDYVVVNFNLTGRRRFDVGVLNFADATGYRPRYVESTTLGTATNMTLPAYTTQCSESLQLLEFYFTPGFYLFKLDNQSYYASWGLTLHDADRVYQGKSTSRMANAPAPGQDTQLYAEVTTAGWYCLAIWRPDMEGSCTGTYQLTIRTGFSDVPAEPPAPAVTGLAGASPNPFNPRTSLAFTLATDATAKLAVHDVRGARVRTLVSGPLPAGRHEAVWDGRDDEGRVLPSGTYVARLEAAGTTSTEKLVLLK